MVLAVRCWTRTRHLVAYIRGRIDPRTSHSGHAPEGDCFMNARSILILCAVFLAPLGCRPSTQSPTEPAAISPEATVTATSVPLTFRQVSSGFDGNHTCGVTVENQAYCWGVGGGALGNGTTAQRLTPVAVAGALQWRSVSAGRLYTCGVTTSNVAYCWGINSVGQLGDGTSRDRLTPTRVAGGLRFRQIDAGQVATCGLTVSNRIYCWGWNLGGEVGDGTTITRLRPVPIASRRRFRDVSVGGLHSCGVTKAHQAFCWGFNEFGQLGNGSTIELRLNPIPVAGELRFAQISAGHSSTCAVTTSDRAYCWGWGFEGRIGDGQELNRWSPRAVSGGLSFRRVSTLNQSCGETKDNLAYCWGPNFVGQLGNGGSLARLTPTAVATELRFLQVSAGGQHSCGVASSGLAYCWGDNGNGELGDGTTDVHREPVPVVGP